ncbi:hypothetical protein EAH79_14835 [Sphingomonas koreensis]|nr:hypothetical protein EAH79_14835 [Sphingomonas koreensis]
MADGRVRHARIDDLDKPLHRIMPVWRLEEVFRLKRLTLVKPSLWEDPREDPCATFMLTPKPGSGCKKPQSPLSAYLAACWAQSWSYEDNSDALLRAYSRVVLDPVAKRNTAPAEEGVRVTTTARRLIAAMETWAARHSDSHFYIAGVTYEPEEQFGQQLAGRLLRPEGPRYFSTPDGRAESLCSKRALFRHEDEVRILCVGPGKFSAGEDIRHFLVDPNALFTEVAFDPRLVLFERREREKKLGSQGYSGIVRDDARYIKAFTLISMDADWPDPE